MFSERIKELREKHGLTQKQFAEAVQISPTTLVSYEVGGKYPSYAILVRISTQFNVSLDWLCDISGDAERPEDTAADVARMVVDLLNTCGDGTIRQREKNIEIVIPGLSCELHSFLGEYSKMSALLRDNTIDAELFNLWYDKRISDLSNSPINGDGDSDLPF